MATMVCRGLLQPCVESQFIETSWPRMPHIKLPSTKPQLPQPLELALKSCFLDLGSNPREECDDGNEIVCNYNTNALPVAQEKPEDIDDWRCLQSLSNGCGEAKAAMAKQEAYVHPLVKRSRSTLSEKSLALCTENLGNETGADFVEDAMFSDLKMESSSTRKRVKSNIGRVSGGNKKFPPPLTTISGLDAIHVRSHREDGRLIMDAVNAPARLSYFQVERSHGRLRLSILKSGTGTGTASSAKFDSEEDKANDDVEVVGEKGNCEENLGGKVEESGNVVGAEIEIEKLERPCNCRCKEAGEIENNNIDNNHPHGMMLLTAWEPVSLSLSLSLSLWVSTS